MNINYIEEHRDPKEVNGFKKMVSDLLGGLGRRNILRFRESMGSSKIL